MPLCKRTGAAFLLVALTISLIFVPQVFAGDIAVYGDSQVDDDAQRKVVKAILPFKPSAVFRVGDQVQDGNDPRQWKAFNDINRPLMESAEYFPALGNHDKDSVLYFDNFPRINHQRWYSVEREGIHFIILDSNSDLKEGSEQHRWLVSDLEKINKDVKFRIAMFHHPIFDVGPHGEDEKKLKGILLPLFKKHNVSAVFSGHDHNYQRFEYDGIVFIITGGGGSRLYGKRRGSEYLKKFGKAYHFCLIIPESDFLRVKVIDSDSNMIDDFNIPARS